MPLHSIQQALIGMACVTACLAEAPTVSARSCPVKVVEGTGAAISRLSATNVSCQRATRIAVSYVRHNHSPHGWRCNTPPSGGTICHRGSARVRWYLESTS